jgi:hypothetical protein
MTRNVQHCLATNEGQRPETGVSSAMYYLKGDLKGHLHWVATAAIT